MGKPGPLELFDSHPMTINEFEDEVIQSVRGFCKNLRNLDNFKNNKLTFFEWYFTFGYWNEAMEFLDEMPKYIPDNLMTL